MRKHLFTMIGFLVCFGSVNAQSSPKWTDKAKKSVVSVITYDKSDKIKNSGNGFFISSDGIVVSDYSLFEGADRAVIVNAEGKEIPVESIMGANSMYDIIKFKVSHDKKTQPLEIAKNAPAVGETIYLLPYATQKYAESEVGKVLKVDSIGDKGFYYTLDVKSTPKSISCPVMNGNGQVIGLIQRSASDDAKEIYAIGASLAEALNISALSTNDSQLSRINIKKALPDNEDQALVYMMMSLANLTSEKRLELLNDFVAKFPNSTEGYIRRATYYMDLNDENSWKLAAEDLKKASSVSKNKVETEFNISKLIYSYVTTLGDKKQNPEWTLEKALEIINSAIKANQNPLYIQFRGDILFAMKKYADAFNDYQVVNQSPIAASATFFSASKAKQLTEGADMNEALALLDSACVRFTKPYTSEAAPYFYERADLKARMNKYRDAVTDYNTFYDIVKGNVTAQFYYQREQAEVQSKMFQQAIDDINKAIELEPNNFALWAEKGSIHMRVAQFNDAIVALEKAKTLDPNDSSVYRMIGYCQIQLKNKKDGIANLTKAKELGDKVASDLLEKMK